MSDTGAPYNIPFADPADTVRTWPALSQNVAEAVVQALDDVKDDRSPALFVENVQTGNYTLQLSDASKVVAIDSTFNRTLTIPTNASVAFPVGTVINVYRANTGAVTITGASGVTLRNGGDIIVGFGEVSLRKRDTNEWVAAGPVA